MKKIAISTFLLFSVLSCAEESLSDNYSENESNQGLIFNVKDWENGDGTRISINITSKGAEFYWTDGDTIGVFPLNGYPTAFPISSGQGTDEACFDGADWSLRPSARYAGYFPFSIKNLNKTRIPIKYSGQTQNGNNSTSLIGKYDYLYSEYTDVDSEGNANFIMNHIGCLARFVLSVPENDVFTSMTISSSGSFATESTFDLTNGSSVSHSTYSNDMSISLSNVSNQNNEDVIVYMMMPYGDYSLDTWTVSLTGSSKTISKAISGKNMIKGKAYSYSIVFSNKQTYTINGVEYPMPKSVDLGLQSGTLWADKCLEGLWIWGDPNVYDYRRTECTDYGYPAFYVNDIKFWNKISCSTDYYDYMNSKKYDIASYYLGEEWCLPTYEQLLEYTEYLKSNGLSHPIPVNYSNYVGTDLQITEYYSCIWMSSNYKLAIITKEDAIGVPGIIEPYTKQISKVETSNVDENVMAHVLAVKKQQ